MLVNNSASAKRYYNIDDIINDAKPSKRPALTDATNTVATAATANFLLPALKKAHAVAPQPRGEGSHQAPSTSGKEHGKPQGDFLRLVSSLLPCRKFSLRSGAANTTTTSAASTTSTTAVTAAIPDVHAFPQRAIGALEVLDAGSLLERHCDWCEAFRSAYQKGCRLYVTHSTFSAVFWPERGVAVMARPSVGFKKLMRSFGIEFQEVRAGGKEYLVVGDGSSSSPAPASSRASSRASSAVHGLYDMIMNEVVGVGVEKKRKDIMKGDFPRLYCEESFRHSSAVAWTEAYDRRRREVHGYLPAWVLEGLEQEVMVRGFEKLMDL